MKQQLQKLQNAAAGFVLTKYASINDVINIKWLLIEERIEYSLAVMGFKAICNEKCSKLLEINTISSTH